MTRAPTATKFIATRVAPKEAEPPAANPRQRRNNMRLKPLLCMAVALSVSAPIFAQEWVEFASREDRFTCLFPVQPKVTETTYLSQHEANLPARIYSATEGGQKRYSVTVVDCTQAQRSL